MTGMQLNSVVRCYNISCPSKGIGRQMDNFSVDGVNGDIESRYKHSEYLVRFSAFFIRTVCSNIPYTVTLRHRVFITSCKPYSLIDQR